MTKAATVNIKTDTMQVRWICKMFHVSFQWVNKYTLNIQNQLNTLYHEYMNYYYDEHI